MTQVPPSVRNTTPQGRGRFPGFDVLGEVAHWDAVTAGVVLARLDPAPTLAFFTPTEAPTAGALLDRLLAQDGEPKVPVLEMVDRRLAIGTTDGWRYDDLPEDGEAWRRSLAALDEDARAAAGDPAASFARSDVGTQKDLLQAVQDADTWHGYRAARVWSLWTRYAATAYYAHPWAWNEIGFGGPAYPRGYSALGVGKRDHWEHPEDDPVDPVTFGVRVEAARRAHAERPDTGSGSGS